MSDSIIKVENLSKSYTLAHQVAPGGRYRYQRFSDVLMNAVRAPFRAAGRSDQPAATREEFWALRDVSFTVKRGEVIGIIGRNGAGKSTLLKILSRITEPTSGRIEIEGRVASLLEVGTGFHPELTGRENIYLNGAILGMTRVEVKGKFDEIVAFAEVEKFLDTPVKHYSSGMYVRLAFAVAAHLEPEILIVDEVLAVGDAQFQKKCLGKMQDVSTKEGRTVLFVSHNMGVIGRLCQQTVLLKGGRIQLFGPTDKIIPHYLNSEGQATGSRKWDDTIPSPLDSRIGIRSIRILDSDGAVTGHLDIRRPFTVEVEYRIIEALPRFRVALRFVAADGAIAFMAADSMCPVYDTKSCGPGIYKAGCVVPGNFLNEGTYSLNLGIDIPLKKVLFYEEGVVDFSMEQTGGVSARFLEKWPGVVCPQLDWHVTAVQ